MSTTVSITMRSLTRLFSMMRGGSGAAITPPSSQCLQARFSRLVTSTKYLAGSTSNCSLSSWPITTVSAPQPVHTHCSGAQAITRSTRRRFDGNDCRPGCLRFVFGEDGSASRWLSASTSALLTPGSSSNNSNCALESFSLPGPYFAMRCNRKRSSSTRIFNSAYCNLF